MSDVALPVVFTVVCALLVRKAQLLGAATAATRGRLKKFIHHEDAVWLSGERVDRDDDRTRRIFRAHRGDLENLLPFFIGGTLYLAGGAGATAGAVYFSVYLACLSTNETFGEWRARRESNPRPTASETVTLSS